MYVHVPTLILLHMCYTGCQGLVDWCKPQPIVWSTIRSSWKKRDRKDDAPSIGSQSRTPSSVSSLDAPCGAGGGGRGDQGPAECAGVRQSEGGTHGTGEEVREGGREGGRKEG